MVLHYVYGNKVGRQISRVRGCLLLHNDIDLNNNNNNDDFNVNGFVLKNNAAIFKNRRDQRFGFVEGKAF